MVLDSLWAELLLDELELGLVWADITLLILTSGRPSRGKKQGRAKVKKRIRVRQCPSPRQISRFLPVGLAWAANYSVVLLSDQPSVQLVWVAGLGDIVLYCVVFHRTRCTLLYSIVLTVSYRTVPTPSTPALPPCSGSSAGVSGSGFGGLSQMTQSSLGLSVSPAAASGSTGEGVVGVARASVCACRVHVRVVCQPDVVCYVRRDDYSTTY